MPPPTPQDLVVHTAFLRRLAIGLLRSEDLAEDAVQETLVLAWRKAPPPEGIRGWLAGTLRNVARNQRRGERRREARHEHVARRARTRPAAIEARETTRRHLLDAILALPAPEREVVLMRFDQGLPPREVASALEIPVHTVHNRQRSGLARMRAELDARYGGDDATWRHALAAFVPALVVSGGAAAVGTGLGGWLLGKHMMIAAGLLLVGLGSWWALGTAATPGANRPPRHQGQLEGTHLAGGSETAGQTPRLEGAEHASTEQTRPAARQTHARLFGAVRDATSGEAIAGAMVRAFAYGPRRSVVGTTDAEGRFDLPESSTITGAFFLVISHPRYARHEMRRQLASREALDIELRGGAWITGMVANGSQRERTRIYAYRRPDRSAPRVEVEWLLAAAPARLVAEGVSSLDEKGHFRLGPLRPGTYALVVAAPARAPAFFADGHRSWSSRGYVVAEGAELDAGILELPELSTIAVHVIDVTTERPLDGVTFEATQRIGSITFGVELPTVGRREGAYLIPANLDAHSRVLNTSMRVRREGYAPHVTGSAGLPMTTKRVIRMAPQEPLVVRALDERGRPRAGALVFVKRVSSGEMLGLGRTDPSGHATFPELTQGDELRIVLLDALGRRTLATIPMPPDRAARAQVTIGGPGSTAIAGVVRDQGRPVERALVSVDGPLGPSLSRTQTWTEADGSFRLEGLAPGEYVVFLNPNEPIAMLERRVRVTRGSVVDASLNLRHEVVGRVALEGMRETDFFENLGLRLRPEAGGWDTIVRFSEDHTYRTRVAQAGGHQVLSDNMSFDVASAPHVEVIEGAETPYDLLLRRDPQDGRFVLRVVDAQSAELLRGAGFEMRDRQMSGGGWTPTGILDKSGFHHSRLHLTISHTGYVDRSLTLTFSAEVRLIERDIALERSNCVRVVGLEVVSRAGKAGLRPGDLILSHDGVQIPHLAALQAQVTSSRATDRVSLEVLRHGEVVAFDVPGGRMGIEAVNHARVTR